MRNGIVIISPQTGRPVSGYIPKLYAYSTGSPYYTGSALYTYTDNGDGTYHADITTTVKGTIVVTSSGSTVITVPTSYIGRIFEGDNQLTLEPGGTT